MTAVAAPEATRERALGVALELFADKGFAATSTREVCERMGFSKAALWYHFKSKDELLAALLAPVHAGLSALVHGSTPSDEVSARREAVAGYVRLVESHADLMRLVYDDPALRGHPAIGGARETLQRVLHRLAGTTTPDRAALARARAALGAVNAVLLRGDDHDVREQLHDIALDAGCGALGLTSQH